MCVCVCVSVNDNKTVIVQEIKCDNESGGVMQ